MTDLDDPEIRRRAIENGTLRVLVNRPPKSRRRRIPPDPRTIEPPLERPITPRSPR